jgi:1-acyl-sn-glycerol-3-phosphate acyltransferase
MPRKFLESAATAFCATTIVMFAHAVTAVRGIYGGFIPDLTQRIYFSNHASHGDFVLIWTVLPPRLRRETRPVAASEYWHVSGLRRFIGQKVFNALLIDRDPATRRLDPVEQMAQALDEGASLIVFPEGTRNVTEEVLLPFRSGLFHLARSRPQVELVPVWIDNLNRVLPKGKIVPVPLICTVTFGAPLHLALNETKDAFLARTAAALVELSPKAERAAS